MKELWKSRDFETIVSGPAETGKTWGCLQYADALLWKYPGAQGVMCRKIYASLVSSAVRSYLRVIGTDTPIKAYGGEKPQWFDYPNGSRLWMVGMDNPGKALSSERDFIYINQAEELALDDFETLMTRATGRGAVMPYTRMFGDCNPTHPLCWIKQRSQTGQLKLLESRHVDNPTLYDDAGQLTEQGKRTMSILASLTGIRRLRLFEGKWAKAEGLVYEAFDVATHVLSRKKFDGSRIKRHIVSVDWGFTNPGVHQVWGIDGDGRSYLVDEVYRTRKTIDWWLDQARRIEEQYKPEIWVCDPAEPSFIEQYQQANLHAVKAFNDILPGIGAVQQRLNLAEDGIPRMFLLEDARRETDDLLVEAKLPTCLQEEMESYSYPKGQDGKPVKETPVDKDNHGEDACRYAQAYLDGLGSQNVEFDAGFYSLTASSQ